MQLGGALAHASYSCAVAFGILCVLVHDDDALHARRAALDLACPLHDQVCVHNDEDAAPCELDLQSSSEVSAGAVQIPEMQWHTTSAARCR